MTRSETRVKRARDLADAAGPARREEDAVHLLTAPLFDLAVEEAVRRGDDQFTRTTGTAGMQVWSRPTEPYAAPTGVAR
jgi:hypothetical protein